MFTTTLLTKQNKEVKIKTSFDIKNANVYVYETTR